MKRIVLLVSVMTLLTFKPESLQACSCVPVRTQDPAKKWIQDFEGVVFRGKVTKIVVVNVPVDLPNSRGGELSYTREQEITFVVEEIWKGLAQKEFKIRTGMGNGDCGVGYDPGKSYFVAANVSSGKLYVGICNTVKLDMKTISELGKGKVPQ